MRDSPIRNFVYVLALLMVMALGVVVTTRKADAVSKPVGKSAPTENTSTVDIEIRMLFSHPPKNVKIDGFGIDAKEPGNELKFSLTLPTGTESDLPLDIVWEKQENARHFTQIIIRRDNQEDEVVTFTDQYSEFSDVFTINTAAK